jgi:DNA-binding response OmpR family regulator
MNQTDDIPQPDRHGRHGRHGRPGRQLESDPLEVCDVHGVRVDPRTRQVWRDGVEIRCTRMEFRLLHCLIVNAGAVVSRQQLMRDVWSTTWPTLSSSKTIDVHLGWLRRKLGDDPRDPHLITTVRGQGLRFEVGLHVPPEAR